MKFCRFLPLSSTAGRAHAPVYGLLDADCVREISGLPWAGWVEGHTIWDLHNIKFLAPCEPSKIVCVGRNYAAHAAELGNEMPKEPLIFLKPPSSLLGPDQPILLPSASKRVEHEGELGVIIGKKCSQLADDADPLSYVLGYTCLNDVTARDFQKSDVQFTRAKGFDTFCPIGPHIQTQLDPTNVLVECRVNGQLRQSGNTSLMAFPVSFIIRWISHVMTLLPGDLIATGTPAGVGPLVPDDSVEVSVAGIGVLRNPVHPLAPDIAQHSLFR
ncbi:MAG TPA: fumarylacetoacetate hydrolase family protein [Verrucomicrobiae bacterium]|nr:fumarylacetoacetate hydrolase family protein [Verrucomicrobiae bacterium]